VAIDLTFITKKGGGYSIFVKLINQMMKLSIFATSPLSFRSKTPPLPHPTFYQVNISCNRLDYKGQNQKKGMLKFLH